LAFQDKMIQCSECGANFTFTAGEQEFYASKGLTNEPKRCPACRKARRSEHSDGAQRQMYTAVCAACGKETQVPFEPKQGRPVYCSACYSKIKGS